MVCEVWHFEKINRLCSYIFANIFGNLPIVVFVIPIFLVARVPPRASAGVGPSRPSLAHSSCAIPRLYRSALTAGPLPDTWQRYALLWRRTALRHFRNNTFTNYAKSYGALRSVLRLAAPTRTSRELTDKTSATTQRQASGTRRDTWRPCPKSRSKSTANYLFNLPI